MCIAFLGDTITSGLNRFTKGKRLLENDREGDIAPPSVLLNCALTVKFRNEPILYGRYPQITVEMQVVVLYEFWG